MFAELLIYFVICYSGKRLATRGIRKLPPKLNETHPSWKSTPCLVNRDDNVLVGGLNQAKIFTNTVEVQQELPSQIQSLYDLETVEKHIELVQMWVTYFLCHFNLKAVNGNPLNLIWNNYMSLFEDFLRTRVFYISSMEMYSVKYVYLNLWMYF